MGKREEINRLCEPIFWATTMLFYGYSSVALASENYTATLIVAIGCAVMSILSGCVLLVTSSTKWRWALVPHGCFMFLWVLDDLARLGFIE